MHFIKHYSLITNYKFIIRYGTTATGFSEGRPDYFDSDLIRTDADTVIFVIFVVLPWNSFLDQSDVETGSAFRVI